MIGRVGLLAIEEGVGAAPAVIGAGEDAVLPAQGLSVLAGRVVRIREALEDDEFGLAYAITESLEHDLAGVAGGWQA